MKKQIVGSLISIAATILISGCSDKNEALKNTLNQQNNTNAINMAALKGKPVYVIYESNSNSINLTSFRTTIPSSNDFKIMSSFNNDHNDEKHGCLILNVNGTGSVCNDEKLDTYLNDPYTGRFLNPAGLIASPYLLAFDILTGFKGNATGEFIAQRELKPELISSYATVLNHKMYNKYEQIKQQYNTSKLESDKKRYEEEYYKFVNLENVFPIKIISKEGKALNVNDDVGLNGAITNTQANGTLKLKAKIALNPNNKYDIPVKYGTHTFKVRFDLLLKYRIAGMGISMSKDETISRVGTVTLSPKNNYSTLVNVDFGKYVQSSQGKLLLFSGGQQLIGTKLNVEFDNE